MRRIAGLWLLCLALVVGAGSQAGLAQSRDDIRALTERAALYIHEHGVAAATAAFGRDGEFRSGELYINVIDLEGRWLIYPPEPAKQGRTILNFIDADGIELGKRILAIGLAGEGWTEYRWRNPATGTIQPKVTYVKRVPDLPVIVYCGLYR